MNYLVSFAKYLTGRENTPDSMTSPRDGRGRIGRLFAILAGLTAFAAMPAVRAETVCYFNGSTHIDIGKKFPLADSVSLSAWVRVDPQITILKPNGGGFYGAGIVGQGYWGGATGIGLFANDGVKDDDTSNDGISWQMRKGGTYLGKTHYDATLFTAGKWHHYLLVRDKENGRARFYVDGTLVNNEDFDGTLDISPSHNFAIGMNMTRIGGHFCGWIADVALWDVALTDADAALLPLAGTQVIEGKPPYAYIPLDEGSGNSVTGIANGSSLTASASGTLSWTNDTSFLRVKKDSLHNLLKVSTSLEGIGSPSPAYGGVLGLKAGETRIVSCGTTPWTNAMETACYACTGWKLYDEDDNVVSNGTETAFTYTHPAPAEFRNLEWQWEPRFDAFAGAYGRYERRIVGPDVVFVFTNHLEVSTLAVRRPVYAEVLLVGGGGGGGGNFGGGGGGGGIIHRKGVLLEPGTYTVTVGAGGAGTNNGRGKTGGTTSLVMKDNSATLFSIPGGGGGGNWCNYGGDGATGGAGDGRGTFGLGCGGGAHAGQNNQSGGGSVIRPGYDYTSTAGGAGAPGYYCDISGENDFYGWGGGGSSKTHAGETAGGAGDPLGYGHGGDNASKYLTAGRPNHGGGGGGSFSHNYSRDGGSGVVIVRWATMAEPADGEPVIRTAGQPHIGSTSLTVSGALDSMGGAASVSVRLLYGASPDALTGSVDLGALTAAGTVTGMITGLSRLTDYWYCFEAAGAATVRSDVRRVKTLGYAEMTWTGLADVTTNGVYEVVSFTNGNATVTFSSPGDIDILAVGGGGGGRSCDSSQCAGGGGGGGGVLYRADIVPVAGVEYQIAVGAGGAGGDAGGDTTIMTNAVDILRAKGGGGGNGKGASGGGVGGNGNRATSVACSAWMQGHAGKGAYATTAQEKNGGGGGGAGGDGFPDDDFKGGDGGPGVMCAITGEKLYYGAGGGGGGSTYNNAYLGVAGLGGSGIGGNGGSNGDGSGADGKPGAVNTGSGGGGGSVNGSAGSGADGIVVIRRRIADVDDPRPQGFAKPTEIAATHAVFEGRLQDVGALGFCDSAEVWVSVVQHGGAEVWTKQVPAAEADEDFAFCVAGLLPGTQYDWAVKLVNANDVDNASWENEVSSGTFTTAAKPEGAGAEPVVAFGAVAANEDVYSISVEYRVPWPGDGAATADVTLLWCPEGGAETNETPVAAGFVGTGTFTLSGLAPGTTYVLSLVATNGLGAVSEAVGPVFVATSGTAPFVSCVLLPAGDGGADTATVMCRISARGYGASSVTLDLDWGTDPTFAVCETMRLMDDSAEEPLLEETVTIRNLAGGTQYYIRARASNDLGLSAAACVAIHSDGTRTYSPASIEDDGTFAGAVFFPGDRIVFPGDPEGRFCKADANAAVLMDGSVLLCREPGVSLVGTYAVTSVGAALATNLVSAFPVVVAPRASDCPAGVWIYRADANLDWTDSSAWVHVSGPVGEGYPDGEGVCALVYPYLSGNRTVTLPATGVTVGFLGLGDANNCAITVTGGPITYSVPRTNAWLRFAGKSVRSMSKVSFTTSVTNRFASSTDIDFMDQVGPNTTWTAMEIPAGVVVRTVRGKYVSDWSGGFTFDGALLGEGTLQFTADCYNTFNKAVETFRGTVDLVRGSGGSDHGAAGINFRFGELPLARELIVHGTFGANGKCAFFESGQGSASGPARKIDAFPNQVTLTGGRLNLGAPGNGAEQGDYRYAITNLHLRGPMGMLECINLTRYGTMYGATTTVFNLDVPFGPTAYMAIVNPVRLRLPTSPEGAVALDGAREILPYFLAGSSNRQPLPGERIYRDRETGFCYRAEPEAVFTNELPAEASGDVKVIHQNGDKSFTLGKDKDFDALMVSKVGWGTAVTLKFDEPDARVGISSGCLSSHTGMTLGPPADANSASAVIDFGRRAYVHTLSTATIGAMLSGSQGLVKTGNGKLVLAGDSSGTLSGGVAVNCGTLTLGAAGYPADLGSNDIAVYAGAVLEVIELKSRKCRNATVDFVDEPIFGAYGKISLPEGTVECYKLRVNGVARPRGTYGATGSGAEFIDNDHFVGSGVLKVKRDDHRDGFHIIIL